eukprot:TRINITY_DN5675_c0_g1_i1.p1 TRINITY_DN5675_c0_g1~~TRINITY_DN5675_c0_g1_i1.p1  ORF type:complete len:920 (+),score=257.88 TRINITY_DN5675_c0_g1_i1:77-2836(+)
MPEPDKDSGAADAPELVRSRRRRQSSVWDGDQLSDVTFAIFALSRKERTLIQYRDLCIYLVFLALFTAVVLLGHYFEAGYYLAQGLGSIEAGGAFDQGDATGLFFEQTYTDIGWTDDWFAWVQSQATLLSILQRPNATYAEQNRIVPGLLRFMVQRTASSSRSSKCEGGHNLLRGDWTGMVGCYPAYASDVADTAPIPYNESLATPGCNGPCGCDFLGNSGYEWVEFTLGELTCRVPDVAQTVLPWQGRFGSYSPDGYVFFVPVGTAPSDFQQKMQCLQQQQWLAPGTRRVEVSFFTYNPTLDLFLHHRTSSEFTPAGFAYSTVRYTTFRWANFDTDTFANRLLITLDLIVFCFVAWFAVRITYEIGSDIWYRKRLLGPFISTWRIVDLIKISFLIVVYFWKFVFWQVGDLILRAPRTCAELGCAAGICDNPVLTQRDANGEPTGDTWTLYYSMGLHSLLYWYELHFNFTNRLTAVAVMLCWMKLFKFVSLSPRMSLLSETIKESAYSLLSLLAYMTIITVAFALMGMILFSSYSQEFAEPDRSFLYLLRWLLGDFDYGELIEAANHRHTWELIIFFWGYQTFVWLVLLNMVISIVSVGFDLSKDRARLAVGSAALGPQLRSAVEQLEMFLRTAKCPRQFPKGPFTQHWDGYRVCDVPVKYIILALRDLEREAYADTQEAMEDCCCGVMRPAGRKGRTQVSLARLEDPRGVSADQLAKALIEVEARSGGVCGYCGTIIDDEVARDTAAATCWIFGYSRSGVPDCERNKEKPAVYEARVYWETQVKDIRRELEGEFRRDFLRNIGAECSEDSQQRQPEAADVKSLMRELLNELREGRGVPEEQPCKWVAQQPPPPPAQPRSPQPPPPSGQPRSPQQTETAPARAPSASQPLDSAAAQSAPHLQAGPAGGTPGAPQPGGWC